MTDQPPDNVSDEVYAKLAERFYTRLVSEHGRVSGGQLEMAKWMIASLLLINGAALVAQVQSDHLNRLPVLWSSLAFAIGVVLAILSGLFTWLHADAVKGVLRKAIEADFAFDRAKWPKDTMKSKSKIRRISNISVMCGLGALICFGAGCIAVASMAALFKEAEKVNASTVDLHIVDGAAVAGTHLGCSKAQAVLPNPRCRASVRSGNLPAPLAAQDRGE